MNLRIQSWKTYSNRTVSRFKDTELLLKSRNCNAVIIFKLPAVLGVEIMFMNGCYDNNSSCESRYINKDFKLQYL